MISLKSTKTLGLPQQRFTKLPPLAAVSTNIALSSMYIEKYLVQAVVLLAQNDFKKVKLPKVLLLILFSYGKAVQFYQELPTVTESPWVGR
jgi:hypothetical protein